MLRAELGCGLEKFLPTSMYVPNGAFGGRAEKCAVGRDEGSKEERRPGSLFCTLQESFCTTSSVSLLVRYIEVVHLGLSPPFLR